MKEEFIRVAERSLEASEATLNANIQEMATFLSYHAFESCGSALGKHIGLDIGKAVNHPTKIK